VMTGNISDLRTGLPIQTVMRDGQPYHEPMRLIALIEAPLDFAGRALQSVVKVKNLVHGGWIRAIVIDPTQGYKPFVFDNGQWEERASLAASAEEDGSSFEGRALAIRHRLAQSPQIEGLHASQQPIES